jgi:hypothetical protein
VPSTNSPGFEPGVDAPTRRALLDLKRQVAALLVFTEEQQQTVADLEARVAALETP